MRRSPRWSLVDGDVTVVDDLVLRPALPWTPTLHALLEHLRARGLRTVPEPVGIEDGVEALRLIPGDSGADAWKHQVPMSGLRSAAELLREVHEASRDFPVQGPDAWGIAPVAHREVVCHGDPGPWNMIWRDGVAVGLIDWDFAHPGSPLDDVAYALEYFAPFRGDDVACDGRDGCHFPEAPNRRERLRQFAAAYGIETTAGLVDRVIARQRATVEQVRDLAERDIQPQRSWVEAGYLDELRGRIDWSRQHRHLFD